MNNAEYEQLLNTLNTVGHNKVTVEYSLKRNKVSYVTTISKFTKHETTATGASLVIHFALNASQFSADYIPAFAISLFDNVIFTENTCVIELLWHGEVTARITITL